MRKFELKGNHRLNAAKPRLASKVIVGWRELADLPKFKIKDLKVKIDTGARTSSLHAEDIKIFDVEGKQWVSFKVEVNRSGQSRLISCKAELLTRKQIKSSTGHSQLRPVILTKIKLGALTFETPVTLTDRSEMGFKMLIGRKTLKPNFVVDCGKSFLLKK